MVSKGGRATELWYLRFPLAQAPPVFKVRRTCPPLMVSAWWVHGECTEEVTTLTHTTECSALVSQTYRKQLSWYFSSLCFSPLMLFLTTLYYKQLVLYIVSDNSNEISSETVHFLYLYSEFMDIWELFIYMYIASINYHMYRVFTGKHITDIFSSNV